jgi:hypothetical protein
MLHVAGIFYGDLCSIYAIFSYKPLDPPVALPYYSKNEGPIEYVQR